ncbi:MAG TPA: hypothetical protein VFX30_14055 [bacterium]|nr:hypothetical protein [bacterium]
MKIFSRFLTVAGLLIFAASGCFQNGADSDPVSLPVPFSGALTSDTNVTIAVGTPLPASASAAVKVKSASNAFPIRWKTVDASTGADFGDLTFLSITEPEVTPFPAAGPDEVRRVYTLSVCTTLADGSELCSDNFKCFEFPTDYPPNFTAADVVPGDSGATAVVRKSDCSGNNTLNGQLISAKFLMGMVKLSDGDFLFHTQQESPMFLNGADFLAGSGAQDSRVVMTILYQGGTPPLPPQEPYLFSVTTPLSLPGSDAVIGTELLRFLTLEPSPDGSLIHSTADVQLLIGQSSLIIKNSRGLFHVIPELADPVSSIIGSAFADDPVVNPDFLENGIVLFNSREETDSVPINCDPASHEATGIFQDLCEANGGLKAQLMCFVFTDLSQGSGFAIEGAWVLLKP